MSIHIDGTYSISGMMFNKRIKQCYSLTELFEYELALNRCGIGTSRNHTDERIEVRSGTDLMAYMAWSEERI